MNSLYSLVKSLDKSEKRYFKIFASRHIIRSNKHEIALFHAIEKAKYPQDEYVKANITDKNLLRNFSLYKHLLYRSLLKCLNTYHAGKTAEDEILELYKSSKILFDKCLFDESKRLIEKAKIMALKNECFSLFLSLSETENLFHEHHFEADVFEKKILNQAMHEKQMLEKLDNLIQYRSTNNTLCFHVKRFGVMDKNLVHHYTPQLPYGNLLADERMAVSDKALLIYWKIQSMLAYRNADYHASNMYENNILQLLEKKHESYPFLDLEKTMTLERMIWNYFMIGNLEKVKDLLKSIESVEEKTRHIRLIKFQLFTNYYLLTCINTGQTEAAEEIESRMEDAYQEMGDAISLQRKLIFNYNLAMLFFVAGDYAKCSKWLETLLINISKKIDTDIMISARCINIILQYEMKMYSLIKYSILSAKRYIKKIRPLNDFDHLLFNTLLKLSTSRTDEATEKVLLAFKQSLQNLMLAGKNYDRCFPYYQWIESKTEKIPLARIIWETNVSGKRNLFMKTSA